MLFDLYGDYEVAKTTATGKKESQATCEQTPSYDNKTNKTMQDERG